MQSPFLFPAQAFRSIFVPVFFSPRQPLVFPSTTTTDTHIHTPGHSYGEPTQLNLLAVFSFFSTHPSGGFSASAFPSRRLRRRRRRCWRRSRRRCQCQLRRHIPRLQQLQQMNKFLLESRTRCHASFS